MPPGAIGKGQARRGGPLFDYFQAVRIEAPPGVRLSLAAEGRLGPAQDGPIEAALRIGDVYRLRIAGIPLHEGHEIFPSIEVIDRLYPPKGQQARFPIPISLSREDLEDALAGKFVVRIVYLEDADAGLPGVVRGVDGTMELPPGDDPLVAADVVGRPMAIVRIGGRVPLDDDDAFAFHTPPVKNLSSSSSLSPPPLPSP